MADPASGVITLITFSLVVIRETKKFIQETRDVPNELQRRLAQLENMEMYMLLLEKHCKDGPGCGDDVLRQINKSLSSLRPQLEYVQKIVKDQASRDSDTLYKKFKMQIRKKISEKEVMMAMEELAYHQSHMALFMHLGIFELVTNINRRTSEVSPTPQSPLSNRWLWPKDTESPMSRTLSQGSTIYETSSAIERTPSSGTQESLPSQVSLGSTIPQASQSGRLGLSLGAQTTVECTADTCSGIHYQIIQASDDDARLCAVQKILEDPCTDTSLVETKDGYGRTPLCVAVRIGDLRLARALVLEYGADINALDDQPWSVLEHALAHKRDSMVEFLIERGVEQDSVKVERLQEALNEILETMELRKQQRTKRKASNSESIKTRKTSRRIGLGSKRLLST